MPQRFLIALCISVLISANAHAEAVLKFIGQFGNSAVITVNGKQRLLKPGVTSHDGIKLVSVDADSAEIIYNREKQTLRFSPTNGVTFKGPQKLEAHISGDQSGGFLTPGTINGQSVTFLVDTGATSIAMNEVVAKRIGIDFRYSGKPEMVTTASGIASAYAIVLNVVKVGEIELRNIQATILEGAFPREVLLGMSFLSQVNLERKDNMIHLSKTR